MEPTPNTSAPDEPYITRAEAEQLIAEKLRALLLETGSAGIEQAREEDRLMASSAEF